MPDKITSSNIPALDANDDSGKNQVSAGSALIQQVYNCCMKAASFVKPYMPATAASLIQTLISKLGDQDLVSKLTSVSEEGKISINFKEVCEYLGSSKSASKEQKTSAPSQQLNLDVETHFAENNQSHELLQQQFRQDLGQILELYHAKHPIKSEVTQENIDPLQTPKNTLLDTEGLAEAFALIVKGGNSLNLDLEKEASLDLNLANSSRLQIQTTNGKISYQYQNIRGELISGEYSSNQSPQIQIDSQEHQHRSYKVEGNKLERSMATELANLFEIEFSSAASNPQTPENFRVAVEEYFGREGLTEADKLDSLNQLAAKFSESEDPKISQLLGQIQGQANQRLELMLQSEDIQQTTQGKVLITIMGILNQSDHLASISAEELESPGLCDEVITACAIGSTAQACNEIRCSDPEVEAHMNQCFKDQHESNREQVQQNHESLAKQKPEVQKKFENAVIAKAQEEPLLQQFNGDLAKISSKVFGTKAKSLNRNSLFAFVMGAAEGQESTRSLIAQTYSFQRGEAIDTQAFVNNFGQTLHHFGKISDQALCELQQGNYTYFNEETNPFVGSSSQPTSTMLSSSPAPTEAERKEQQTALETSQRIINIAKRFGISTGECASVACLVRLMKQNGLPVSTILNTVGYSPDFMRALLQHEDLTGAAQVLYANGESLDINELFNFHRAGHSMVSAAKTIVKDRHSMSYWAV